jgi:hypothetical protein
VPDDELEKLRSSLAHAYDQRKPITRRLIQAVKDRVGARTPAKTRRQRGKAAGNKDAA